MIYYSKNETIFHLKITERVSSVLKNGVLDFLLFRYKAEFERNRFRLKNTLKKGLECQTFDSGFLNIEKRTLPCEAGARKGSNLSNSYNNTQGGFEEHFIKISVTSTSKVPKFRSKSRKGANQNGRPSRSLKSKRTDRRTKNLPKKPQPTRPRPRR